MDDSMRVVWHETKWKNLESNEEQANDILGLYSSFL